MQTHDFSNPLTAILAVGSGVLLGGVMVICLIMLGVLWICLAVTLLSMAADQAEKKLDDLKRSQNYQDDGEKSKMECELNERLRLCNETIRACDELLCRPLRIFGKLDVKRDSGTVESHQCGVGWFEVNKLLKLACGRGKKELLNLVIISRRLKIGSFFRCHKSSDVAKPPNEKS